VATTVALLPRNVTIVVPRRRLEPNDLAAALTVSRALGATGRRVRFLQGLDALPELARRDGEKWERGLVVIAPIQDVLSYVDTPVATGAGPAPSFGALTTVRIGGVPILVVTDAASVRAGRLLANPALGATRGVVSVSVGEMVTPKLPRG